MLIWQARRVTFGNIIKYHRIQEGTVCDIFHRGGLEEKRDYCNFDIKYKLNMPHKTKGEIIILVFSVMPKKAQINPESLRANLKFYYILNSSLKKIWQVFRLSEQHSEDDSIQPENMAHKNYICVYSL
jgi:hypothetical protein